MNLLRKIGKWCWDKKERMVLIVTLVFLGYRIYAVIQVTSESTDKAVNPPSSVAPVGELPTKPTRVFENVDLNSIIKRPIFKWESPGRKSGGSSAVNAEDAKLKVVRIIEKDDGNHTAVMTTGGKNTFVKVDKSFESYTIISIDVDDDDEYIVVVYSENSNGRLTVKVKK